MNQLPNLAIFQIAGFSGKITVPTNALLNDFRRSSRQRNIPFCLDLRELQPARNESAKAITGISNVGYLLSVNLIETAQAFKVNN